MTNRLIQFISIYSDIFYGLWKITKKQEFLEWQFLIPRWINLEMDSIVKKIIILTAFTLSFIYLLLPFNHHLITLLFTCFTIYWIHGIYNNMNQVNVELLMQRFLNENSNNNQNSPSNHIILINYIILYWLKISPNFMFIQLKRKIESILQFITAIWFNNCFQQNIKMVKQHLQTEMCEYDAISFYLSKMKLDSKIFIFNHLASQSNESVSNDIDDIDNNVCYYLPKDIQNLIINMCFDNQIQNLSREYQIDQCCSNNLPNQIDNKEDKKQSCFNQMGIEISEYLFGNINDTRMNIKICYNNCQLGGSLSGFISIPAICNISINYGNGTFDNNNNNNDNHNCYQYDICTNMLISETNYGEPFNKKEKSDQIISDIRKVQVKMPTNL